MMISIVMPIYNAERYLEKSLESIVNQTYKNIEIILINDGSTDNSMAIAQKYKDNDTRVTLLEIENSGPGVARNLGIEKSKGDYISFVDADDCLLDDSIEILLNQALDGDYDVVSGNHYRVAGETTVAKTNYQSGKLNRNGTKEEKKRYDIFKTSSGFGYIWGKLYKKSFIMKNKIEFNRDRKVFLEDNLFNLKVLAFDPKYFLLNKEVYYYNIIDDSLSNTKEDITDRAIKLLRDYEKFLNEEGIYQENIDLFILLATRTIAWSIFKTMEYRFTFKNIYSKIKRFSNQTTIKKLFSNPNSLKEIIKLDSNLQILLYSFIVISIRYRLELLLSVIFFIFYPLFNIYIKKSVKS